MASKKEKWQKIADLGLQDRFDPETRIKFDKAVELGLITMPEQQSLLGAATQTARAVTAPVAAGFAGAQRWSEGSIPEMWSGQAGKEAGAEYDRVQQGWAGEQGPRALEQQEMLGRGAQAIGDLPAQAALAGLGLGSPLNSHNQKASRMMMEQRDKAWQGAGDATLEATGSPALATGVEMLPIMGEMAFGGIGAGRLAASRLGQRPTPDAPQMAPEAPQGALAQLPAQWRPQGIEGARKAEQIASGSNSPALAKYRPATGKAKAKGKDVETFPEAKAAIGQGWDKGVVQPIKQSNAATKQQLRKQLDIWERAVDDKEWGMFNRPTDAAGDSLMNRVNVIMRANKGAGKAIGDVGATLKGQPVETLPAIEKFRIALEKEGVEIYQNDKGDFVPNFDATYLGKGDHAPIKEVFKQMNARSRNKKGGTFQNPDAFTVHKMKQAIDRSVSYGKVKTGMTNDAAKILKDFRRGLDNALDSTYPDYNDANVAYKETITALDSLQDIARQLDFDKPDAHKFTGTLMRRLMGNAGSRVPLGNSLKLIESTAQKYLDYKPPLEGGVLGIEDMDFIPPKLDDNLYTQILLADEMDRLLGPVARTSMEGLQATQSDKIVAAMKPQYTLTGLGVDAAKWGTDKALGRTNEKAVKAMRRLVDPLGELSI